MKPLIPLAASILLAGVAAPVSAVAGPTKLAEVDLRDAKDWDRVRLPDCRRPGNTPVTRLGVAVTRHAAEIDRLEVTYFNGEEQVLRVRDRFAPGSASRWIDLSGEARCIRTIRIIGDTDSLGWRPGKQAHVTFWGQGPRGTGKAPSVVAGPEVGKLGQVRLKDAKDWDRVVLPACASSRNEPVTSLKLAVREHPAQIDHLVVRFHNGQTQTLQVRDRFAPGTDSRWIDLAGPARCIQSIRIVGDTNSLGWRPGKQAQVLFFGRAG